MTNFTVLNQNRDFNRIYKKGSSTICSVLVTYILKNNKKGIRLGITTSKKIGNAVQRNRARRVIKESFRQLLPHLKGNFDVVFVARGKTPHVKMQYVKIKMMETFKKSGFFKSLVRDESSTNKFNKVLPE